MHVLTVWCACCSGKSDNRPIDQPWSAAMTAVPHPRQQHRSSWPALACRLIPEPRRWGATNSLSNLFLDSSTR